jgi:hypothetical protein
MRIPIIIQYILIPTISTIASASLFYLATTISLDYKTLFLLGLAGMTLLLTALRGRKE